MRVWNVEGSVNGAPEKRHDGDESGQIHQKSPNRSGSVDGAEGILDVSGYEELVRCRQRHGPEVVHHAVSTTLHEGTILIWSNSLDDIGFGVVKDDAGGEFEENFKQSDWSDSAARLFAQGLDLSDEPEVGNMLWNGTPGPGKDPEPGRLDSVWGL